MDIFQLFIQTSEKKKWHIAAGFALETLKSIRATPLELFTDQCGSLRSLNELMSILM